ncbi:MAG: proline dehydrogenase family protein [Candidatus Kerfeldbacteria bacterium]|nr:proline dehydrogenase family protein [Candidatus Kerfeldbacteria bacterium]
MRSLTTEYHSGKEGLAVISRVLRVAPRKLVWQVARRYIAGPTLVDAVATIRSLNDVGFTTAVSYLGEHATTLTDCDQALHMYQEVLELIRTLRLRASLSVKPSQLGLKLHYHAFLDRAGALLAQAESLGTFVRWDMEDASCTHCTLEAYRALQRRYPNTGVVLQASLRRSLEDARRLSATPANVRVCKGAYREPADIAHHRREAIRQGYVQILRILLRAGCFVGIATHDAVLISAAKRLIEMYRVPPTQYEFEVLLGVRPERAQRLLADGHPVLVYVPFGQQWFEYSTRRFDENPQLLWTIARATLLGR